MKLKGKKQRLIRRDIMKRFCQFNTKTVMKIDNVKAKKKLKVQKIVLQNVKLSLNVVKLFKCK